MTQQNNKKTRQYKTIQDKSRQYNKGQYETITTQYKARAEQANSKPLQHKTTQGHNKTIPTQDKTKQHKTRQYNTRNGKTRQSQNKARQDNPNTRQDKTLSITRQGKTKQETARTPKYKTVQDTTVHGNTRQTNTIQDNTRNDNTIQSQNKAIQDNHNSRKDKTISITRQDKAKQATTRTT